MIYVTTYLVKSGVGSDGHHNVGVLDPFLLPRPVTIGFCGQDDGLKSSTILGTILRPQFVLKQYFGSACRDASAGVGPPIEQVAAHPDDLSLHLPDAWKRSRVEGVGPGRHPVDSRHQLCQLGVGVVNGPRLGPVPPVRIAELGIHCCQLQNFILGQPAVRQLQHVIEVTCQGQMLLL